MAIPSRQIGWSTKSNLLWQISKQLEYLTGVLYKGTTTTTTTIAPFINIIIISNGSYSATNGTYTRSSPSSVFTQTDGGTGTIFFGGDAWYLNGGVSGNVARNTSELGTGTWDPWAPGNSSGITAQYIYSNTTTTTTTTVAPAGDLLTTLSGDNLVTLSGDQIITL